MIAARYTKEDRSEAEIAIDGVVTHGCRPHHWQWVDMVQAGVTPGPYGEPEAVEQEPVRDLAKDLDALTAALVKDGKITQEKIDAEKGRAGRSSVPEPSLRS